MQMELYTSRQALLSGILPVAIEIPSAECCLKSYLEVLSEILILQEITSLKSCGLSLHH